MTDDWHIIVTASGRPLTGADGSPIVFPSIEAAGPYMTRPGDRVERWEGSFRKAPSAADLED